MELTDDEARTLSGAYALDAVTDDERVAIERLLATDTVLAAEVAQLCEAAGLLGTTETAAPPARLSERTLGAAFARRAPGIPAGTRPPPVQAYRDQMDDLSALLDTIAPGDWAVPTVTDFTVHELVAHLLAIEGYVATRLGVAPSGAAAPFVPPEGTEDDHRAMTEATIGVYAGRDPAATVADWRALVDANLAHLDTLSDHDLDRRVSLHGLDLSLRSMLGARVFEVWTHSDDIRRALDRPLEAPDPARLTFMSDLAVGALPLGLLLAGIDDPGRTIRVVLTGDGGGDWLQPLTIGAEPGPPDATLVADVVDFCRLAAQRLAPAEIAHRADGDAQAVQDVLEGAQVFAA